MSRILALLGVAVLLAVPPGGVADASEQSPPGPQAGEVVPGEGLQPTGSPEPSTSQRVIDTLVWFWLLAVLVVAATLGVRYVVGIWRSDGTRDRAR